MKSMGLFRPVVAALALISGAYLSSAAELTLNGDGKAIGIVDVDDLLGWVDTRVGTDAAVTKTAGLFGKGSEEHGQTLPAVGVPHGMNLWTPQTRDTEQKCIAPYYFSDSKLQGFRNSHWIVGGCTQDYGSMTLQAMSGDLRTSPLSRATRLDHNTEIARPDYYSVFLPEEGMKAEMTGLSRAGIFRFAYWNDGIGHLVVNPNSDECEGTICIDIEKREIRGSNPIHRIYQGWGNPTGASGYFVVKIPENLEIVDYGTFSGDSIYPKNRYLAYMPNEGAYISFRVKKDKPVQFKVGSSFTSEEAALKNLEAEISGWNFDSVRKESAKRWRDRFEKIQVEGGSPENKAKFYGSLYRCSLLPRVISDVDGSYPRFARGSEVMKMQQGDFYDDYSMWDTYRALHPLLTLIDPKLSGEMMQSLVLKGEQGGWMPIFPCWGSYTAAMIGDHCAVAIADAAVKDVDNFDIESAYRLLRRNAFDSPATYDVYKDGMGRRALQSYLKYGYIPVEDEVKEAFHQREQTSRTLEYAFDDFALSQLAGIVGAEDDRKELSRRSGNWRNVIDSRLGYANGRHADGSFVEETDPFTFNSAITEGAPCHYTWYVPHDTKGLIEMLGGKERAEAKLDSMFSQRRYWHGNEPCHQIAYLYNDLGAPQKTRQQVRHILDTEYLNVPGGLSGNDDAGQMSAWLVFSAMGFYPVAPSTPYYYLSAPVFEKITISQPNGKEFVIKTPAATLEKGGESRIKGLKLNGKEIESGKISHNDIRAGGILEFY